ncbi:KH domain-containing protein [Desulfovirgula thermocuniculi]|uniref:KH domain-containing protein n=1 Tax=Desulfovirgula thermocuniculi TaxID=348842 RepID=UPI0003FA715B|nr:KH domain-containing protein [Desulfovirgula thermocuniculi]
MVKEVVEILAKALVDHPDKVSVNVVEKEKSCLVELKVAPEDMGKIIGKQGRVAKAIRAVAKAAGTRQKKKVTVEIG